MSRDINNTCLRITVQAQQWRVRKPEAPSQLREFGGSAWVVDLKQLAGCGISLY